MKIPALISILLVLLTLSLRGQTNSVIDSLEHVLKNTISDTSKSILLSEISKEYRKIKDWKMSFKTADAALQLAKQHNYIRGVARAYGNTVQVYLRKSISDELPDFLAVLYAYLHVFDKIDDKKGVASAHINIGNVYKGKGNYTEALNHYFKSLEVSEQIGDKNSIAGSHMNIGGIYHMSENYEEALNNYFIALKIAEDIGNKLSVSSCYNDIGMIYGDMGQPDKALNYYLTSLEIKKEIGFMRGLGNTHNNIGIFYEKQGNYQEALNSHLEALRIRREIGHEWGIAGSYNNIGKIYRLQGNYQEARKNLNSGLALSKKVGRKSRISDSYEALSELEIAEGNFKHALEYYKMFALYEDSISNEKRNEQIAALLIQFESEKKDREIDLLNRDNKIKALQLEQQKAAILNSNLEAEKSKSEIQLLNSSMEIQRLKLSETRRDLEFQEAEAQMKDAQLVLLNKDRALKEEQLERQELVRNTLIIATALLLLVGFLIYRSLRLRKKLEKQEIILEERKRISADLHDDIGSGLSKIMLLSELVKHDAKMPDTRKDAEKISTITQDLSSNISEIIWALNANNDYVNNLVAYIRRYAAEYFDDTSVKLKIKTADNIDHTPIRTENRRNIFYAVKEALHNIIKHSKATEAKLDFDFQDNKLEVIIHDNGIGIPRDTLNPFGNGIKNMKNRMTSIQGELNIENDHGTKITLTIPF